MSLSLDSDFRNFKVPVFDTGIAEYYTIASDFINKENMGTDSQTFCVRNLC